jgi:hypothetical protein
MAGPPLPPSHGAITSKGNPAAPEKPSSVAPVVKHSRCSNAFLMSAVRHSKPSSVAPVRKRMLCGSALILVAARVATSTSCACSQHNACMAGPHLPPSHDATSSKGNPTAPEKPSSATSVAKHMLCSTAFLILATSMRHSTPSSVASVLKRMLCSSALVIVAARVVMFLQLYNLRVQPARYFDGGPRPHAAQAPRKATSPLLKNRTL